VRTRGVAALVALFAASLLVIAFTHSSTPPHAPRQLVVKVRAPTPRAQHGRATIPAASSAQPRTTTTATTAPTTTVSTASNASSTQQHAAVATSPPASTTPTTAPLLVTRLAGIGGAQQVVAVVASSSGSTTATISAYQHDAGGWRQAFGPWSGYIGRDGAAPIGAKREGDGRTPSGVFGFDFMFGVNADPGVRYQYRRITGPNIVWDDDSSSPLYNEWVDDTTTSGGADPEPMDTTPSYLYGVVLSYNDARTPGLGSGIFLHVNHGSPTSGCISLPEGELLDVLRWLDPAESPRIAIGTLASLTS
jgi:L,D-peptidoglycan transpeptidase YkuD (ErfK/YbiS/YcfS/YnhG family)